MAKKVRRKVTLGGELMFPSDYLAAVEFKGKEYWLTISAITREALPMKGEGETRKTVMRFKETKKKLIINATNADVIAQLYGTKAEDWIGKRIALYPTQCMAFGEMVDCLRIREKAPPAKVQAPADGPDAAPATDEPPHPLSDDGDEFVKSIADDDMPGLKLA